MNLKLSVVIVSWNTKELLKDCLLSLLKEVETFGISTEIFVIDNNSSDGSGAMVRSSFPTIKLTENLENKGFGKACNQAIQQTTGEYVLLLNPDTVVLPGSINTLLQFAETHPQAGVVAPQLLNTDGSVQRSCRSFPSISGMFYELSGLSRIFPNVTRFRNYKMLDFDHQHQMQVDQPEGAGLLIPKKVLDEVGLFDEKFFMLFEEVDLCYRIKQAGWEIWFNPESKIIHHYGQSIKQIKAKMIIHSHKGMYYYWAKHHNSWYHQLFKPFFGVMLLGLAVLRIIFYKLR